MTRNLMIAAMVAMTSVSLAQPTACWQQTFSNPISGRYGHFMGFDRARQRTVVYGGYTTSGFSSDVWELEGRYWFQMPSGPGQRAYGTMAYDENRHVLVACGGNTSDELWEYDGVNWTRRFPTLMPPGYQFPSMWFNPDDGLVYLYGGTSSYGFSAGTWTWDGSRWRIVAAMGPQVQYPAVAYDRDRHVAVMFGGISGSYTNQTWELTNGHWVARTPAQSPAPRYLGQVTYDESRQRTVLFGGYNGSGNGLNDTWEWDGTNWTVGNIHSQIAPPPRYHHSLVYDNALQRTVVFGGYSGNPINDTWIYALPPESEVAEFVVSGGTVADGNLNSLRDRDNDRLGFQCVDDGDLTIDFATILPTGTSTQNWLQLRAVANQDCTQLVDFYNWTNGNWDQVGSAAVSGKESLQWAGVPTTGQVYTGPYGIVRARVHFVPTLDTCTGLRVDYDHVAWFAAR
ncbi:MAG TPA: kelch repeat-containing protein [Fimbriimonadaceae bacterium]|nr:kelch repeat-containing protein [Fimbriimonadaceae bacterium]